MSSILNPDFGPTLPELIKLRLSRSGRIGVYLLVVLLIGAAVLVFTLSAISINTYHENGRYKFSFNYPSEFKQVKSQRNELVRLEERNSEDLFLQSFTVAPLTIPKGTDFSSFPSVTRQYVGGLEHNYGQFRVSEEGPFRLENMKDYHPYTVVFVAKKGNRSLVGRSVFIPPKNGNNGLVLEWLSTPAAGAKINTPHTLGDTDAHSLPLFTFRLN